MDFEVILHYATYIAFLVLLPVTAGVMYYVLLLHQALRNDERFLELGKREGRRHERLRRYVEAKRLADPFFHFNIGKARDVDELVAEQLAIERGLNPAEIARDQKIQRALDDGRLIMLDTALDDCAPGMVVARHFEIGSLRVSRGTELTDEMLEDLRERGADTVPVLYNPSRVAGAIAGRA